jgi:hypothetical protein
MERKEQKNGESKETNSKSAKMRINRQTGCQRVNSLTVPDSGGYQHLHTLSVSPTGRPVQRCLAVLVRRVDTEPKGHNVNSCVHPHTTGVRAFLFACICVCSCLCLRMCSSPQERKKKKEEERESGNIQKERSKRGVKKDKISED